MIKKVLKWIFQTFLGLLIILLSYGSIKQWSYDSKVQKEYPPTGKFADIGNNKIHYDYSGSGDLTIVLIAGLGETMHTWSGIKKELTQRGGVFMYDRSGLGQSEPGVLPRSVDNIATELHYLLENEKIPGPYVLIGHSAGGFSARYYANKYPKDVIGLFIIDPYQEMGKEELGEWPLSYKIMNWSLRKMSWSGIPYFLLPNPPHPMYKTSKAIKTFGNEAHSEDVSLEQFNKLDKRNSDLPFYILTAHKPKGTNNELSQKWNQQISEKYAHEINKPVIVNSGHHIHIEKPEFVLQELDEFIARIHLN